MFCPPLLYLPASYYIIMNKGQSALKSKNDTMKSMKKLIIGNWKMAPDTLKEAEATFFAIKEKGSTLRNVQTVVCPPFVYIETLAWQVSGHRVVVGAQDVFYEKGGAFTGEVSTKQLASVKAKYVIIGHSERRATGETDEEVAKKVTAALKEKLNVILCVGERERDDHGDYTRFIADQVKSALAHVKKAQLANLVIAYEPIWAIGKDALHPATPADALEVSILIRKVIADMFHKKDAFNIPILYGGSADDKNAEGFLREGEAEPLEVVIVRDTIAIPTIDVEFRTGTGEQIASAEKPFGTPADQSEVYVIRLYNFSATSADILPKPIR